MLWPLAPKGGLALWATSRQARPTPEHHTFQKKKPRRGRLVGASCLWDDPSRGHRTFIPDSQHRFGSQEKVRPGEKKRPQGGEVLSRSGFLDSNAVS
jgi:hypothetical protein